jgi:peptidoglycan/LPS O-acetylase OafA/YrhL
MATLTGVNAASATPGAVRSAGVITALQGATALVIATVLVWRGLLGADQRAVNGFGTAAWFALIGGGVLAAARALLQGRRWGRGVAVFANLTLLPIDWYLGVGSHRWGYGTAIGVVALAVLVLLFSPAAVHWAARGDESGTGG